MAGKLAGRRNVERRDDADDGGNFVRRQRAAAQAENLVRGARGVGGALEHDVRGNERTGDRTGLRADLRHPYGRVPVDRRLHLLGVNLESADVDDAAAASEKVITVPAALDDVAGVDKPVWIGERPVGLVQVA